MEQHTVSQPSSSIRVFMVQNTMNSEGWKMVPSHEFQDVYRITSNHNQTAGYGFISTFRDNLTCWLKSSEVYPDFEANLSEDSRIIIVIHVGAEADNNGVAPEFLTKNGIKGVFQKYIQGYGYLGVFKEIHPGWQLSWGIKNQDGKSRAYLMWPDDNKVGYSVNWLLNTI